MVGFVKFYTNFGGIRCKRLQNLIPIAVLCRYYRFDKYPSEKHLNPSSNLVQRVGRNNVAVFWDLDNKPPKSVSPFDAAVRLKKAAESFGIIRYKIAYANQQSFSYVPPPVRKQRKDRKSLSQLENMGVVKPVEPYICRVCGRRFYSHDRLMNHFKQIHEREHLKRLQQIESARGSQRVKLVGKYSMKMEKYENAARDILIPKVGYGLGDELKRAGFWVGVVSNKPQAADIALKNHMVDLMDKRRVECVILVSDDSDFLEVLKEAKLRCLRTVVVGDNNQGALKRVSDASFSWDEVIMGKAKKEGASVLGRWRDRDILKRLEWTYNFERERKLYGSDSENLNESEDSDDESFSPGDDADCDSKKDDFHPWWKLESASDTAHYNDIS